MARRPSLSPDDRAMAAGKRASNALPEVVRYGYVDERCALRLELADGVALELPLDTAEGFKDLTHAQRAAITVGPSDKVEHEATDQIRHLSEWLASHPQLVRLSRSVLAWRQAVSYHRRPLPIRTDPPNSAVWERMPASFRRRMGPILRDPQIGTPLAPPAEGYWWKDPVSGCIIWFRRSPEQVTVLSVLTPSEQARLWDSGEPGQSG